MRKEIISASAGSGKTYSLTEYLIQHIKEGGEAARGYFDYLHTYGSGRISREVEG